MAVYACSDIHGQYGMFLRGLEEIGFCDDDRMYIIGDVIDRGPESIPLLQDIIHRKNITLLIGNHEYMMTMYLRQHRDGNVWTRPANGGSFTHMAYELLGSDEQAEIREFLDSLYLQLELEVGGKTYLLSHSAFKQNLGSVRWQDAGMNDPYEVVWYSPWRNPDRFMLSFYQDDGREHITGHVPVQRLSPQAWTGGAIPQMPQYLRNEEYHISDIDLGCAAIPMLERGDLTKELAERYSTACLCILDLEKHAAGAPDDAWYIMPEK